MAEHPLALGDDGVGLQKACKPGVVPSGPVIIQVGDLLVFALTGVAQRCRCAAGGQAGGAPGVVAQLGEQVTVGLVEGDSWRRRGGWRCAGRRSSSSGWTGRGDRGIRSTC